ncbi:plakophilin-3 isoform X1 [Patagioenas fasciata]|uniref:plakophilin-3 isoform X1 n=1 Tax=Patagioenas fasciata TaxID=372321 RepID=UPI0032E8B27D
MYRSGAHCWGCLGLWGAMGRLPGGASRRRYDHPGAPGPSASPAPSSLRGRSRVPVSVVVLVTVSAGARCGPLPPGEAWRRRGVPGASLGPREPPLLTCAGRPRRLGRTAAMQEPPAATNPFLLSALQPEAGVCSLALPSDRQLDGRGREAAEAQRLRSARVQEQVRIRMMLRGQAAARPDGPDHADCARGGQYGTALHSFSSRSQSNGLDPKASLYQPLPKKDFGTLKGGGWSSRSAVDLTSHKRVATISNGGLAQGRGYGPGYAVSPATSTSPRPSSFHERAYRPRQNFDTLSLRSLRLADGPLPPPAMADDRYSVVSEQLDPLGHRPLYKSQGNGGFARSYTFERQLSAGSAAKAPSEWLEGSEVAQSRTIRAPAMRTLQRFQSNNRSRLSAGSFGSAAAGMGGSYLGLGEHGSSRAPSVRSLAESGQRLQDQRAMELYNGHGTLLGRHAGGFDDIDLPSAVKYLIASDPNLQVLGAAYLQHKCYSDGNAKKQARSLQAMPKLVKLFNSPNQEVQRHATGAMRNLIYDNAENKLALVEENGIYELMRTLREPDDELRKNVTGILWNLSSSDNLKDRLARDTLEQLTDTVLVPLSGLGGSGVIQQNPSEAEIFYNSTGFLRNLSSASQQTRQKMRECHGLVDAMIHYVNSSLEVGKSEDKSVENAVCVLRNLSYRLYDEMPPSSLQRLEGHRRNGGMVTGELVGCFSPQSKKAREHYLNADIVTFTEVSKDPKGMEWLWNPQIVGIYNRLLQRCELNKHTTEAASGALQNITAGDRRWAGVLSRLALEQERILNPVLDRVRTADHHQLRSLTGLIRNLSRHARNKDEMSTKVVSHLIEKLPGSVGDKAPPADVIVNIIAVLNNLVVESPMAARDIVYFDGLRKLFYIKKRRDSSDNEKSSRAAASLLGNMWQYTKLHRDFKMKGYRKEDFLGL